MNATKTQALLEAAREKLGGVTDYKLAKTIGIHRQRMSRMHEGTTQADAYDCTRLAEILGRDPLEVIAEVEAEAARTKAKREFWLSFRGTGRTAILGLALSGILGFSGAGWPGGAQAATPDATSHNVYYVK